MPKHRITDKINLSDIKKIMSNGLELELSAAAKKKIKDCRKYLDQKIEKSESPIYGINTGFGSLHNVSIENKELGKLQENLVRSHACGMGDKVPVKIAELMLLLKIQGLSYGHSGVALETVERLVWHFNNNIIPVVYELGSLGASGDLAPLAHLSLPLIGDGEVYVKGEIKSASSILKKHKLQPLQLQSKEGLALLNGTQFMSSYAVYCVLQCESGMALANQVASISLDAFLGRYEPFDPLLHKIRNQKGQIAAAKAMKKNLQGSKIGKTKKEYVQDPYSFRCIPQVHGASWTAFDHAKEIIENEINAVTDNPTIFPKEDKIISGGNFHGQPLALALDYLSIAMAEMGSISERRIYKLVDGQRELPSYLVNKPGINSGFMIVQYTAAAIVSQNKSLCFPNSVDSVDSSQGQEDHVSMGANAATKAKRVLDNWKRIMAAELLTACQAIEFRRPLESSKTNEALIAEVRKKEPFVKTDRAMYKLLHKMEQFVDLKIGVGSK